MTSKLAIIRRKPRRTNILNSMYQMWSRRATEPYHVLVCLMWLYGDPLPSDKPLNRLIPAKTVRNGEIYRRYQSGESPTVLAREYKVSEQRIYVIVRRQRDQ